MAGCSQTLKGLQLTCDTSKGGIKEVYIAKFPGVSSAGTADGLTISAGTVTAVDSGVTFYQYEFRRNTGSMTSTLNVDDANGTNYVSTDLVLQFNKMETVKRVEMSALSLQECLVIVVDSNNIAWVLGVNEAVTASAGSGQTGQAKNEGNFYQLTLQANDDTYPLEYTGAISDLNIYAGS
jgi:hypothetical protein